MPSVTINWYILIILPRTFSLAISERYTGAEVVEEGLSGRTTVFKDPLRPYGCGVDYIEACAASHAPFDLLICMLGTNDMRPHLCNLPQASARGAAMICQKAQQMVPGIKVLFVSPIVIGRWLPQVSPMYQENMDSIENTYKFAKVFKEQADLNGFYFLDAAAYAEPSKEDAVHMSPEAHKKLAIAIAEKVKEIMSES